MSRRTLSLALLVTAVAPALLAEEPGRVVELYMVPPHFLKRTPPPEPSASRVVRREPVEAPRPPALISYSPVEIQMQPIGEFDISCSVQLLPESSTLPVVELVKVSPEPAVAPKPEPVTTDDPSIFFCPTEPFAGAAFDLSEVSASVPASGDTP